LADSRTGSAKVAYSKFAVLVIAAFAAMVSPAFAQQAADAAKTAPATQSETKTDANTSPSNDAEAAATAAAIAKANAAAGGKSAKPTDEAAFAKKAKGFGWHAEDRQGVTVYCREAPLVGSRFTEKKCAKESQLALILEQQEYVRDQLKQRGCGGNCGGN
jgi:hypothetical protein